MGEPQSIACRNTTMRGDNLLSKRVLFVITIFAAGSSVLAFLISLSSKPSGHPPLQVAEKEAMLGDCRVLRRHLRDHLILTKTVSRKELGNIVRSMSLHDYLRGETSDSIPRYWSSKDAVYLEGKEANWKFEERPDGNIHLIVYCVDYPEVWKSVFAYEKAKKVQLDDP